MKSDLELAMNYLMSHPDVKVVAVKEGHVLGTEVGDGLRPLVNLLDRALEVSEGGLLRASVADRVIGEAAAVLLIDARVTAVFGQIMSVEAEKRLTDARVLTHYGKRVDKILARDGQSKCFMERQVEGVTDMSEAVKKLRNVLG